MDYDARKEKLRKICKERRTDAYLTFNTHNRRYFSGFTGSSGAFLLAGDKTFLFTDSRYSLQASEEACTDEIIISSAAATENKVLEVLSDSGACSILVEGEHLNVFAYLRMQENFGAAGISLDIGSRIGCSMRMVKEAEEIRCIRKAAATADRSFAELMETIRPGMTEKEVAAFLEYRLKCNGADGLSFPTIAISGPRTSLPHGKPSERKIGENEFILIDFGCICEGYCSDMTRTFIIGEPTREQQFLYDAVLTSQELALQSIAPGKICKDIDRISRDYLESKGLGGFFGHGLGHSLGLEIHENPRLAPDDATVIREGMVLTVEPGVYTGSAGGVRIEDLIVVGGDGAEILSGSKKMISLK